MPIYGDEDREGIRPYVVRFDPAPIPAPDIQSEPLHCLRINEQWVPHFLGALQILAQLDTWQGTKAQRYNAVQQIERALADLQHECYECPEGGVVYTEATTLYMDVRPPSTNGGTKSAGTEQHNLNTVVGWVTGMPELITQGQILRFQAGTYRIEATAQAYRTNRSRLCLTKVNPYAGELVWGENALATVNPDYSVQIPLHLDAILTFAEQTDLIFQQYAQTAAATYGFGVSMNNASISDVYAVLKITKQVEVSVIAGPPGPPGPPGDSLGRVVIEPYLDSLIRYKHEFDGEWSEPVQTGPGQLIWDRPEGGVDVVRYYHQNLGPIPTILPGVYPEYAYPKIVQGWEGKNNVLANEYWSGIIAHGDNLCEADPCALVPFESEHPDKLCEFATKVTWVLQEAVANFQKNLDETNNVFDIALLISSALSFLAPQVGVPAALLVTAGRLFTWGVDLVLDEYNEDFWTQFKCGFYCAVYDDPEQQFSDDDWKDFISSWSENRQWDTEPAMLFWKLLTQEHISWNKLQSSAQGAPVTEWDCLDCGCGFEWYHVYECILGQLDGFQYLPLYQAYNQVDNYTYAKDQGDGTWLLQLPVDPGVWPYHADETTRIVRVEFQFMRPDPDYCTVDWFYFGTFGPSTQWQLDLRDKNDPNGFYGLVGYPDDIGPLNGYSFQARVSNIQVGIAGGPSIKSFKIWGTGADPDPGHG